MSRAIVPTLAAALAAAAVVAAVALVQGHAADRHASSARLAAEVVNDHLRLLVAAHAVELESSDPHELKPWLARRLDFSPGVPAGEGELRLRGATVGYVFDHPAAVLVYGLRLHQLTLLASRAADLAWPAPPRGRAGPPLEHLSERGFHVVLWRAGDLGYALVSDSSPQELTGIAQRLAATTVAEAR